MRTNPQNGSLAVLQALPSSEFPSRRLGGTSVFRFAPNLANSETAAQDPASTGATQNP